MSGNNTTEKNSRNKMEILINNDRLLMDIQGEFSRRYPFLKLEFLEKDKLAKTPKTSRIDPRTSLKKLNKTGSSQKIDINNRRTVSEISTDFANSLDVIVQVYRKSGNVWNVISITDGWTLESQNSAGEFISLEMASIKD